MTCLDVVVNNLSPSANRSVPHVAANNSIIMCQVINTCLKIVLVE